MVVGTKYAYTRKNGKIVNCYKNKSGKRVFSNGEPIPGKSRCYKLKSRAKKVYSCKSTKARSARKSRKRRSGAVKKPVKRRRAAKKSYINRKGASPCRIPGIKGRKEKCAKTGGCVWGKRGCWGSSGKGMKQLRDLALKSLRELGADELAAELDAAFEEGSADAVADTTRRIEDKLIAALEIEDGEMEVVPSVTPEEYDAAQMQDSDHLTTAPDNVEAADVSAEVAADAVAEVAVADAVVADADADAAVDKADKAVDKADKALAFAMKFRMGRRGRKSKRSSKRGRKSKRSSKRGRKSKRGSKRRTR